jgi:hypothetical protein
MMDLMLYLMMLLVIKHLIIDFFLQPPYMYLNKGTYGHFGGIVHAIAHIIPTIVILVGVFGWHRALLLSLIEGILHYHIDWLKVNVVKKYKWGPTTHEQWFYAFGIDQFLHYMTYILILSIY